MMRCVARTALATALAVMIFGAAGDVLDEPHAGTKEDPWPIYNVATVAIAFDNAYAVQIVRAEAEIKDELGAVVKIVAVDGRDKFPLDAEAFRVPIYEHAVGLPNDALYQLRARVSDEHGNVSGWSATLWAKKYWVALEPPGGCVLLR